MTQTLIGPKDLAAVVESVVIAGDLSSLQPAERVAYYRSVCESLGLNPLTKPFEYITLNNRLTLYARKDATDQLRAGRGISVEIKAREFLSEADLYVVTARAFAKDGRTDESVGAVSVRGLQGENLANALMRAETKAKRRVTLSVAGLGWLDEVEAAAIPDARPAVVDLDTGEVVASRPRQSQTWSDDPLLGDGGRVNWSAFWLEVKRLGFDQRAVHDLAGTSRLAQLDQSMVVELLETLRERADIAASQSLTLEVE